VIKAGAPASDGKDDKKSGPGTGRINRADP
jgi:hypothetical protein